MTGIRCAVKSDAERVLSLMQAAKDELGHSPGFTIDPDMAVAGLRAFAANPSVFFYVIDGPNGVTGMAIGAISSSWCTRDKVASDILFYCLPQHRGRGAHLIKRFISWAQGFDAVRQIVLTNATDDPKVSMLFGRLGFHLKGGLFIKECPR